MSLAFQWVIAVSAVVACLAVLVQAIILAGMYRGLMEAQKAGKEAQAKVGPLVERFGPMVERFDAFVTNGAKTLEELSPRLNEITAESLRFVQSARQHADRVGELIDETNDRAKARIAQIDQAVEQTVQQVENASDAVKSAVMRPVKEVNGFIAGVKAALNTYAQGGRNTPEHVTQDEEMFI